MSRLCEAWWHAALPSKEAVIAKTIPFVLMSALRRVAPRAAPRAGHAGFSNRRLLRVELTTVFLTR